MSDGAAPAGVPGRSLRAGWNAVTRRLPAVRLLWVLLAILAAYGILFLATGIGLATALGLPILAAAIDLLFQRVRFERFRFPDAAIATGLFLAVVLPPAVPAIAAGASTFGAIALRHVLRRKGRPWLNPAAAGVLVGALFFGLSPAWWAAISEPLVLGLGAVLFVWQLRNWRLPVVFLIAYAGLAALERVVFSVDTGATLPAQVLLLSAIDPTILFFGLFMVAEPRTAPTDRAHQVVYAIVVATAAALLPLALPTVSALVGLLLGNVTAVVLRSLPTPAAEPAPGRRKVDAGASARARAGAALERWSVPRRVGVGLGAFILVGILAAATVPPNSGPSPLLGSHPISGGGGAVSAAQCQTDNASVSASTLASLHKSLGPSVVLSYNPSTNLVVFYDPVNAVTVTETDLYEDYGFAEFNGDDYTSAGCVPP